MGFFKKKTEKTQEEEKTEVNKAEYNIVLLEKLGGTVRIIQQFEALRWRDDEDHVVYLKSKEKKKNFLEIFPQTINDFKNYTEDQVDKLISKYEGMLEKERHKDSEDINDKNLEFELLKLKAKKRSFKYDPNSSYLSFNEKSRPTFYFLREGSTFYPFKWDTETKTIFVPSDNRKKSASISLRNKENKYGTNTLINGAGIILIIIGLIFAGAGGYFMFKANKLQDEVFNNYDASELAESQRICLENLNNAAKSISESAKDVDKITTSIEENLNKPQTVIEGVIPQ